MSKIFVLRTLEDGNRMIAHIKMLAGPAAAAGRPLSAEIGEYQEKRSGDQNRRLWALLTEIAEQVEVGGKRFTKEAWFEFFKSEFGAKQEGPNGLVSMSTTQMTKQQFADFMTRIEAHAVTTLGVEFAAI